MAGTRLVMTMGVVAVGAGAMLALSTLPAFAPYRKSTPERMVVPDTAPLAIAPRVAPDDYADVPALARQAEDDVRLGIQDGAVVLQLPRWTQDGEAWVSMGRRAWRDWVEPGDETGSPDQDERSYAEDRPREWEDGPQGYARNAEPRRRRDYYGYGDADRWSDLQEQPYAPPADEEPAYAPAPRRPAPRTTGPQALGDASSPPDDAAASAAERARAAARDVRIAQDAG